MVWGAFHFHTQSALENHATNQHTLHLHLLAAPATLTSEASNNAHHKQGKDQRGGKRGKGGLPQLCEMLRKGIHRWLRSNNSIQTHAYQANLSFSLTNTIQQQAKPRGNFNFPEDSSTANLTSRFFSPANSASFETHLSQGM